MRKFFGTKAFYKRVFALAIPVMLQGFMTQLVSLLDNVMVGQLGPLQIASVSITNQIFFILNLSIFGAISGAEIFGAQFYGKADYKQQAHTFWMKVCFAGTLGLTVFLMLALQGPRVISLWLHDSPENAAATLSYAMTYMSIMFGSIPFYCLTQTMVSTLKECQKTIICMESAILALVVNLTGDYLLIFGRLGLPALGVAGAAIATVLARCVECLFVLIWIRRHIKELPVFAGVFSNMRIPGDLAKTIILKSLPLMINETLWSGTIAFFSSCYSTRGLTVVSALAIVDVVTQLFRTAYVSIGSAIAIILGNTLGRGDSGQAIADSRKLLMLSILIALVTMVLSAASAPSFASLYNVPAETRALAVRLIYITAALSPINSVNNAAYFIIRSGGNTLLTFALDGGISTIVGCPLVWVVCYLTNWDIFTVYLISQCYNVVKIFPEMISVHRNKWARNLT